MLEVVGLAGGSVVVEQTSEVSASRAVELAAFFLPLASFQPLLLAPAREDGLEKSIDKRVAFFDGKGRRFGRLVDLGGTAGLGYLLDVLPFESERASGSFKCCRGLECGGVNNFFFSG